VYDDKTRIEAKRLWILGGKTDIEIAQALGIVRPDTIRDWRTKENWEGDKELFESVADERAKKQRTDRARAATERMLQFCEAFSHLMARLMRDPCLKPTGYKALISGAAELQKLQTVVSAANDRDHEGDRPVRRFEWVLGKRPEEEEILRKYREGLLVEKPRPAVNGQTPGRAQSPPKPAPAPPSQTPKPPSDQTPRAGP
jgi:hypothetical protein